MLALMNSSAANSAADCWAVVVSPALSDWAAARTPPSTAACSFALTLYNIVASMASPTNGIRTNGSIIVNMIIMLPPWRLRLRFGGPAVSRASTSGGLEYRIRIIASLSVPRQPRALDIHFHNVDRLAGLVAVPAAGQLPRLRNQVELGA